jgi:hypothetical protein
MSDLTDIIIYKGVRGDEPGVVLRANGGIFRALSVSEDNKELTLRTYIEPTDMLRETADIDDGVSGSRGKPVRSQQWTLDKPTNVITGLWHLEGEEVSILGDGSVLPSQTVENGRLTLPIYVTRCSIGLRYTARAKTLPLTSTDAIIEGRRKRVTGIGVRVDKSRGLHSGYSLDQLYAIKERTSEAPGLPTRMISGVEHLMVSTNWDDNGQTYFVQSDPLPVTILSIVQEVEVGDDPD